jgi:hypothetical protein
MKHRNAKPSEQIMRFFTPELFVRFNSPDEDEADEANEAWETALLEYREHLDAIRDRMPSQVRKLAELCLHDAELLACEQAVEPLFPPVEPFGPHPLWSALAILSVNHDRKIVSLIYILWDRVREYPSPQNWPFSKLRTHWLYDEVDLTSNDRGMFLHRVLLSDGRVLEIPFMSAVVHKPISPPSEGEVLRHSALPGTSLGGRE